MKMQPINVRLPKALIDNLRTLASTRNESTADVMRNILEQGISTDMVSQNIDTVTRAIRKTIRDELKSTENRLATLSSKGGIAAASAMYLADEIYIAAGNDPQADRARSVSRLAAIRAKAAKFLKVADLEEE